MDLDRRSFLAEAGKYILLTGAATLAWEHVVAGTPETAPNYAATDHWWGMIIDIDKCIGCGNCVRACKARTTCPRAATSAPGSSATRWIPTTWSTRASSRPTAAYDGFPASTRLATASSASSSPSCATTAPIRPACRSARSARPSSAPTAWCWWTRLLPGLPLLRAGLPVRLPLHPSADEHGGQVHALLPPDHAGADHGVLRELPDRRAAAGRFQEPEGPGARVPARPTRCTCSSRRWRPAPRCTTTGLDGSVR